MHSEQIFETGPFPSIFIGTWTVMQHSEIENSSRPIACTIKDLGPQPCGERLLEMKLETDEFLEPQSREITTRYLLTFDGTTNELRLCRECGVSQQGDTDVRLSLWRAPGYDMIFAVHEEAVSLEPNRVRMIWSAKRRMDSSQPKRSVDHALRKAFEIKLSSGFHAQEPGHQVVIRRLAPERHEPKEPIFDHDYRIYGLFYYFDDGKGFAPGDVTKAILYDILVLDEEVRSLNSIFGARSLTWADIDEHRSRLVAALNNNFSLPSSHIPSPSVTIPGGRAQPAVPTVHRLGQRLPFEGPGNAQQRSIHPVDLGSEDDPESGVWEGEQAP